MCKAVPEHVRKRELKIVSRLWANALVLQAYRGHVHFVDLEKQEVLGV
jgi:hypothetical protein